MTTILAIETATKSCSVALFNKDSLIAKKEQNGNYSHAENLAVFANELLEEQGIKAKDLNAVAVSKGPGSYTGLRIGVSFAKGLCYSLKIPLISISTLKSMAFGVAKQIEKSEAFICPMIDARRMEVYSAVYNSELELINPITAKVIDENSFSDLLSEHTVLFLGDGAEKCKAIITSENAQFIEEVYPSASNMGKLAFEKYKANKLEDVAYFEPYYLKEFIAIKGKKML